MGWGDLLIGTGFATLANRVPNFWGWGGGLSPLISNFGMGKEDLGTGFATLANSVPNVWGSVVGWCPALEERSSWILEVSELSGILETSELSGILENSELSGILETSELSGISGIFEISELSGIFENFPATRPGTVPSTPKASSARSAWVAICHPRRPCRHAFGVSARGAWPSRGEVFKNS